MKKKILIVILVFLFVALIGELLVSYNKGHTFDDTTLNLKGRASSYTLKNSSYAIGSTIPAGTYKISSKDRGATITVQTKSGLKDFSSFKKGSEITVEDGDILIVGGGSVVLK